jgi:hypothetical protein
MSTCEDCNGYLCSETGVHAFDDICPACKVDDMGEFYLSAALVGNQLDCERLMAESRLFRGLPHTCGK